MKCLFSVSGWLTLASAAKHHLFVGTFSGPYLYALEFDDATFALTLIANISASSAHSWIALSHNNRALYGSAIVSDAWYSYTINNSSSLTPSSAVKLIGNCFAPLPPAPPREPGTPASGINVSQVSGMFILGASTPPYNVYGTASSCGNAITADPATGTLLAVTYNLTYSSATYGISAMGMHGMAISFDGRFYYSADARANSLWTYAVHKTTGELDLVDVIAGPVDRSNPRHVAVHSKGGYLYVVLEAANALRSIRWMQRRGSQVGQGSFIR